MRRQATKEKLQQFMAELAGRARGPGKVYFTGGATALLLGFREQTLDIDIKLDPEPSGAFEAIAALKNRLELNIELAAPDDFIPAAPNWRERSRLIASIGRIEFFHYDLVMQTLAKLERGHAQDVQDAQMLLEGGFVTAEELRSTFAQIEPGLVRYPAIAPEQFRAKVDRFLSQNSAR